MLTYFNGRGRGEPIRLLFAAGGIQYEDVRIEGAQWPALKPNTPFGHLPVLEVDGVTLSESTTIARFVAKRAGLAGEGDVQQARADMVVDAVRDIFGKVAAAFTEKDETRKKIVAVSWSGEGSRLLWLEVRGDVFTTSVVLFYDVTNDYWC
ncbi:PREDICTED: hematopoietic prostaglandin D synthase-like [Branchiostoma belcheri]|uniref:glutathione transferase n=1 Tax=Branchiostoma belcheri TaxID=7741 RepID=A0A6P4XZQ1_BRABE|nr:PREDICTED: hematopoietic prostaglandin D synthase-like [Branchiostoma belcheri]